LADGAKYTGIFVDSPAPQRWDLDTEMISQGKIELFTRRGFYLYTFAATSLPQLIQAFTRLTGRAPLPPRWSLGHQQCRWSYPDEETIRELARQFRSRKIPCDTLVLDIDYMDEYRVFTYSKERFPSFPELAQELDRDHFKLITVVDPGVKKDEKYQIYRQGIGRNLFCKTARGEVFNEMVWPGLSAFPDFLKEETRMWWQESLKFYVDNGIAGIWNDMNEPAMFNNQTPLPNPLIEMPEDDQQLFLQQGADGPIGHFEVRNLYGFLMSLATRNALAKYRPDERPFVLTRAASTGIQRHAAVWLGDNTSWFEHLQKSLPMLLNVGLSGVPFAGVDIGGFGGDTTPELLVRWYEIGIFYPFFRNHCALMGRAQEPFSFSAPVEAMVRHLIEWRYRLLPYIQGLFWEHMRTGAPLMRPMAWHYADDEIARDSDDQFMFGQDIMVAPIFNANQKSRYAYFPQGNWYSLDSSDGDNARGEGSASDGGSNDACGAQAIVGGQTHRIQCQLGRVPAFVREGAVIALADIMQSTEDYDASAITFHAFGHEARGKYFEDDGRSLDYQSGRYNEWELTITGERFEAKSVHKSFDADKRKYLFKALNASSGSAVELLP
jgi:alpha-glucosidase